MSHMLAMLHNKLESLGSIIQQCVCVCVCVCVCLYFLHTSVKTSENFSFALKIAKH